MKDKLSAMIREAIAVNERSFPWERAIGAGIAMTLPIFIGLWLNLLPYGLMAGLGGFTYLYAFRLPYAHLSKRLLFVGATIVLSSLLGSLTAPYPIAVAVVMGAIAAVTLFIFNALKFIGPSAIFFVLIFALTADMPHVDLAGALMRAGLVSLGAMLSWLIAMSGFLIHPHRPEIQSLQKAYQQLIQLTDKAGTDAFHGEKYKAMAAFKEAHETLMAGRLPWSPSETYRRLLHLAVAGNEYLIELSIREEQSSSPMPKEARDYLTEILRNLKSLKHASALPKPPADLPLVDNFIAMHDALTAPIATLPALTADDQVSIRMILAQALDRNSLVFLTAVRFGIITTIASLIAHGFDFTRSYWIPLSCVAVMSGASMVATLHRALQRSLGTMIGIIIASLILYFEPTGYPIALFILLFTIMTELCIVKNYGLAVIFITPNALLLAETISAGDFSFVHFASARILDVTIGSIIGIIGVMIMGKRSASVRMPRILMRTLRSQSQMLLLLFGPHNEDADAQLKIRSLKMQTNLANLTALYTAAIGEIPKNKALIEYYWPIIYSLDKLSVLLERAAHMQHRPTLSPQALANLLYLFETLANHAQSSMTYEPLPIPDLPGFSSIAKEIDVLQSAFKSETTAI
ncbi:FUSC family protein [Wohlfahrtiimonas chitiniclastica]|uniref:FUSC family protein n=1 Tax=Wohlfahrtiimonas chitiniclastica TaxID=400946 RepID=UPI001BD1965F|nr:FUSC family protein [Wohlfahrtiimonas chitiniclastica]MBS7819330.1 FUSC family protein [Wohlfahrtiimonas chitiniclastica]MBS7827106.1 FUSC family protein [Wohlfahrtiimonas chitiniclastica]